MEVFKDVKGYKGKYEVSNLGRVKSLKFNKEKILKAGVNANGYLQVNLFKDENVLTNFIKTLVFSFLIV